LATQQVDDLVPDHHDVVDRTIRQHDDVVFYPGQAGSAAVVGPVVRIVDALVRGPVPFDILVTDPGEVEAGTDHHVLPDLGVLAGGIEARSLGRDRVEAILAAGGS